MKLPGYKILKEVAKKRVITLGEARKLFTTNFNDQRDFFALASRYTERYVDSSWVREGCNWDTDKISLVARELYFMSLGPGKHTMVGVYEDIPDIPGDIINERDYNAEFKIYCTGKTDLFFHEQRSKRFDPIVLTHITSSFWIVLAYPVSPPFALISSETHAKIYLW